MFPIRYNSFSYFFSYRAGIYLLVFQLFLISDSLGQDSVLTVEKGEMDIEYVREYNEEITGRLYASQKYTSILIPSSKGSPSFKYRPNTTFNTGVGATYRSFSLNLAYGFPGINGDGSQRGKTKYLDLQSHMYGRKTVMDFFGQFYKGYYISPKGYVPGYPQFYIAPDMKVRMVGGSFYYVFNNKRFSYRAGLIQNEWQTKSAGSLLLGVEGFYGVIKNEGLIIPAEVGYRFPQKDLHRFRFINFGPGIGYAYTYVYQKHWFATGSLTVNFTLDFSKEKMHISNVVYDHFSISPNYNFRFAIGYNSRRWIYSASIVQSTVSALGASNDRYYRINTGNYRFNISRRFTLDKKAKRILAPIDKYLN